MAKNERIEQIERALWLLEYKDHWTREDWTRKNVLEKELAELRIDNLENS